MSIRVMSQVWDDGPLAYIDRYVLLAIADNANDDGYAYPSIEKLAEKTQMSRRTVMRSLQSLEEDGWIISRKRSRNRRFSTYEIQLGKFSESRGDSQSPQKSPSRSDSHNIDEVTPSRSRGDSQSEVPQTPYIVEPSLNRQDQPPTKTVCESFGERCFKAYPKKTSPKASVAAFATLIRELRDNQRFPTLTAAGNWLLQRVQGYAASPCVTTRPIRFVPKASAWVSEGKYDEDSSVWNIAAPPPTQNADFHSERAQLARIM